MDKRLVLVSDMNAVLRQALIGYDKNYDLSATVSRSALRKFVDGFDEETLEMLQQAHRLTPEDVTLEAWIEIVRQSVSDPVP